MHDKVSILFVKRTRRQAAGACWVIATSSRTVSHLTPLSVCGWVGQLAWLTFPRTLPPSLSRHEIMHTTGGLHDGWKPMLAEGQGSTLRPDLVSRMQLSESQPLQCPPSPTVWSIWWVIRNIHAVIAKSLIDWSSQPNDACSHTGVLKYKGVRPVPSGGHVTLPANKIITTPVQLVLTRARHTVTHQTSPPATLPKILLIRLPHFSNFQMRFHDLSLT